jgi:hypothetical protein
MAQLPLQLQQQPQPDFSIISDHFGQLSEQFQHCANLPAVNEGAELRESLATLTTTVNQLRDTVHQLGVDLRDEIRGLGTRLTAR